MSADGGSLPTWAAAARERLAALTARYELPPAATQQLLTLLVALTTDPLAPTSVRDPMTALDDHIADSLVVLELLSLAGAPTIADIGSGAGLPALPLAIALPDAAVTAVESSTRKCEFIARTARDCGLANLSAVHARAEAWPDGLERFDLVTARALAPLDVVVEYAAPLLRLGGTLAAWRGRRDPAAEASALLAAGHLGLEVAEPRAVRPYPGVEHRHLHMMVKRAPTPAGFPRRPGIARKRPLGSVLASSDRDRR